MSNEATSLYYVRNSADTGNPFPVTTGSKRAAARIVAGTNPLASWTFEVWTESEWNNKSSPSTYAAYEL